MTTPPEVLTVVDVNVDYKKGVSEVFSMLSHKWILKAVPDDGDPFRLLVVNLILQSDGNLKGGISLTTKISLDKKEGVEGCSKSQTLVFTKDILEVGFDDFIIVDDKFEGKYLKDDNLVFHVTVEKEKPLPQIKKNAPISNVSSPPQQSHSDNIRLVQPVIQNLAVYSHSTSPQPTHPAVSSSPGKAGSPFSSPLKSFGSPLTPLGSSLASTSRPNSAARPSSSASNSRPSSAAQPLYSVGGGGSTSRPTSGTKQIDTIPLSGTLGSPTGLGSTVGGGGGGGGIVLTSRSSPTGNKMVLPSLTHK